MKRFVLLLALAALAACAQKDAPPQAKNEPQTSPHRRRLQPRPPNPPVSRPGPPRSPPDVPAGEYKMDRAHSTLIFRLSHMGFSKYTARFRRFDAKLQFDPRNLTATQLTATVDPRSIETDYPDPKYDFNAELAGEQFLNAAKFPEIAFRTTRVEDLGNQALRVHGELTMHGVTGRSCSMRRTTAAMLVTRWTRKPASASPHTASCAAPISASPAAFRRRAPTWAWATRSPSSSSRSSTARRWRRPKRRSRIAKS